MNSLHKTLILSVAVFGVLTLPAMAQDSDMVKGKAVDMAKDKIEDMAKDAVKVQADKITISEDETETVISGDPLSIEMSDKKILATEGEAILKEDVMTVTGDTMTVTETSTDAPAMENTSLEDASIETVNIPCPEGTTAQSNGTCMITGDYDSE